MSNTVLISTPATVLSTFAGKLLLTLCALAPHTAWAAPSVTIAKRQQESSSPSPSSNSNSGGGGGSNLSPQIWIPIVVVVIILLGVALYVWSRHGWRFKFKFKLGNWSTAAALATGTVINADANRQNGARELTAELLAGTSPASTPATATATRARRSRRNNRRTASMISTRSLPMYMKEPGDEELVIYRGPSDMEDMPENMMNMPPVEESAAESPDSSVDMSRTNTREYGLMPDSPHDLPLLSPDDFNPEADLSGQTLIPPPNLEQLHTRPSFETLISIADSHAGSDHDHEQQEAQDELPDPRGEAPPYFEVVAMDELNATTSRVSQDTNAAPEAPTSPPQSVRSLHSQQASNGSRRRSIFGFFNRGATSPPPVPGGGNSTAHARTDSGPSVLSMATTSNDGHSRTRSRSRHRPSQSTSNNSVFSLSSGPFRTISRQRSRTPLPENHLTSASMISVNSISAPLTHTLVRTEFTYPKSGPTAEQLKLISSRETFVRFGVPYGPDAIAYHASQSRVDLAPPPGFDEVTSGSGAGPSNAGSSDRNQEGSSSEAVSASETAPEAGSDVVASSNGDSGNGTGRASRRPSLRVTVSTEGSPSNSPATSRDTEHPSEGAEPSSIRSYDQRPAEQIPLPPSPSKAETGVSVSTPAATASISAPHPPPGLTPTPAPTHIGPPSSFKDPSTTSPNPRSESRASSYLSFATAEESLRSSSPALSATLPQLNIPTNDSDASLRIVGDESPATTAPPTPRMTTARSIDDDTDTTATPTPTTSTPSTIPVH